MKTGDTCRLLQVTKITLYKEGKISGNKLPNGYWNWDDESVSKLSCQSPPAVNQDDSI